MVPLRLLYSTGSADTGTGASAVAGLTWMEAIACSTGGTVPYMQFKGVAVPRQLAASQWKVKGWL